LQFCVLIPHNTMNSRCFVLQSSEDETLQTCRFKLGSKKQPTSVMITGSPFQVVTLAGTIPIADNSILEMWQINEFNETTVLQNIFNIPLLSTFLVYPLVLRIVTQGELPTVGRLKKMLCEQLVQTVENQFIKEDEDELLEEELLHDPPSLLVDDQDDDDEDDVLESDGIDSTDMSDMEDDDDDALNDDDDDVDDDVEDDEEEGLSLDI
jgi:hypothetical protein